MISTLLMGTTSLTPVAPSSGSYNKWRLVMSSSYASGQFSLFAAEMRETIGGADITTAGNTIQENQVNSSFAGSMVWDDNASTRMVSASATVAALRQCWTGQDFGVPKTIREISLFADPLYETNMPVEFSVEAEDSGTWKKLIEFQNMPYWAENETRVFPVPTQFPAANTPYITGLPYGDDLLTSTSAYATKGGVHTVNVDSVITGFSVQIGVGAEVREIVVAVVSDNGSTWNVNSILGRQSYTGVIGYNYVHLDTPISVSAGQTIAFLETRTNAANDATSSGIRYMDQQGPISNPLFTEIASQPGFRKTSRNIQAGDNSTDKSSTPWGIYPHAHAAAPISGLNTVSARYWRVRDMDCASNTQLRVGFIRFLDGNLFTYRIESLTVSPSVVNPFRLVDGAMWRDNAFGTTDSASVTFDYGVSITPAYLQIVQGFTGSQSVTDFVVDSSDDNTNWTTRYTLSGGPLFGNREMRYYQL